MQGLSDPVQMLLFSHVGTTAADQAEDPMRINRGMSLT